MFINEYHGTNDCFMTGRGRQTKSRGGREVQIVFIYYKQQYTDFRWLIGISRELHTQEVKA